MKKISKVIALLLASVMVSSMLAACGSGGSGGDSGAGSGKTLYVGGGYESLTLDPLLGSAEGSGAIINNAIYGTVWNFTTDGEMNYEIAESYEWLNDDMTEIEIKIRDDAKFSDGTDITAEDLLATYQYNMDGPMFFYVLSIDFANSKAVDAKTLDLKLSMASSTFTEGLSLVKILSASDIADPDKMASDPNCSGAYMVDQFATGMDTILVKNPGYYAADELLYDKVVITANGDESTLYLNFQTGEYDIAAITDVNNIVAIQDGEVADAHIQVGSIQKFYYISMNVIDFPEFADINIRGAIAHAVDWETLIREVCGETVQIATSGILPSANWAYKDEGVYAYDPELAKEMLAKSGYGTDNPFTFEFTVQDINFNAKIAEAMQAYLKEVGINMTVTAGDGATIQNMNLANQLPMVMAQAMGCEDPGGLTNSRMGDNPINSTKFGPVDQGATYLQDLVDAATVSTEDQEIRKAMFAEAQDLTHDYYYALPLYEDKAYYAAVDSVGDFSCAIDANSGFLHLGNFKAGKVDIQK